MEMIVKKAVLHFYLSNVLKSMRWFILIFMAIFLFFTGLSITLGGDATFMSGLEPIFAMYFMILCMNSFTEETYFFLQHGVSRKTIFMGFALHMLIAGAIGAVLVMLTNGVTRWITSFPVVILQADSVLLQLFPAWFETMGTVPGLFVTFFWTWTLFLAAGTLGYFFTTLFYRLNKLGKVLVPVGAGVIVLFLPPLLITSANSEAIYAFTRRFWWFLRGSGEIANPMNSMGFFLVFALVLLFICWLLVRQVQLKK